MLEARDSFRALESAGLRAPVPLSFGTIGTDECSFDYLKSMDQEAHNTVVENVAMFTIRASEFPYCHSDCTRLSLDQSK